MSAVLTDENMDEFLKLYNDAVDKGLEEFQFEGDTVYVAYATYVLQYLKDQRRLKDDRH